MIIDFVRSAFPWVLMGLAVAIIFGRAGNKKEANSQESQRRIAAGAFLGIVAGIALSGFGLFNNQATGMAIGALWGIAIAQLTDKDERKEL